MIRPVAACNVVIVGTAGIGVAYDEADGRSQRLSLPDAREHLYPILLVTRAAASGLTRATAVHKALQCIHVDVHASRHPVKHATHCGSVRLAKGGQCQYLA